MANGETLRVFADANVLIRASTFPRFPYAVLDLAVQGKITVVVSASALKDARHYLEKLFPEDLFRLESFLANAQVEFVGDPTKEEVDANRNLVRDTEDAPVALAAINARVDFLVSTDTDLTDVDTTTEELRARLAPGRVMKPGEFLNQVMGWTHEALEAISRRWWSDLSEEKTDEASSGMTEGVLRTWK